LSVRVEIALQPGQRKVRRPLKELVEAVLAAQDTDGSVAVALVDEAEIRDLNARYRGLDEPTDVLSFRQADGETEWPDPTEQSGSELGELVICPTVVRRYAQEEGGDPETQLGWVVVHGVLHLLGYDHETDDGEMREREQQLMVELGPRVRAVSRALKG
jgi:rRNA maturation RNase YbeY